MKKEDIEKLQKKFKDLNDLSKKYNNLGYKKSSKINFYKPKNDIERLRIREINNKLILPLFILSVILFILFILSLFIRAKIYGIVIMSILTLICIYVTLKVKLNDELMIGKAAFKERIRDPKHSKKIYNYYVSVVDEDNKLIYTRILVSKEDFDSIEEGTFILISKATNRGYIYNN